MPSSGGSSSSSAGAVKVLYDSGALGAPAANIDTGANGIAQTARHLRVYVRAGSARAANASDNLLVLFNNDSAAHYDYNLANNHAGSWAGAEAVANATPQPIVIPAATALRSFGIAVFDVVDYTANTEVQPMVGLWAYTAANTPNDQNGIGSMLWTGNAPITRLAIQSATSSNLITGSRMTVYGFS